MRTISLTEFNQNPSRATRLADVDEVIVLRRGVPAYRLERVRDASTDPLQALAQAGLLTPPRREQAGTPRPYRRRIAHADTDLGGLLDADRGRLDD